MTCQILWSKHLSLLNRLRCQEVRKTWRRVSHSVASDLPHAVLAEELAVSLTNAESPHLVDSLGDLDSQRTALRIKEGIYVACTTEADPAPSYTACWHWLSPEAELFPKILLTGDHPQPWQLKAFLELLQTACTRVPLAFEVKLAAGALC